MRKYISPFVLLIALLLFTGKEVMAQGPNPIPPDCVVFLNNITTASSTPSGNGFDNRFIGCVAWTLQYQSTGFTGLTVTFQSSVGSTSPTSFGTYTGTVTAGAAAMTSTTGQISTFVNGTVTTPWVRVNVSGLTGTGTINGVLYGYKSGSSGGGGGGGGGGSCTSSATPCFVEGLAADGANNSGNPVFVAGHDNSAPTPKARALQVDTNGQLLLSSAAVAQGDGTSNTPNIPTMGVGGAAAVTTFRNFPYTFNSSTWDRQFACTNQAVITISSGTDAVIVAGVAATNIRICHLDFISDTTATFTIRQGTGTTCGTNTATIAGPYPSILGLDQDYTPAAALRSTVAGRDICLHSGATVTVGGVIFYAQY